jgi:integrase
MADPEFMDNKITFTKTMIARLLIPETGRITYHDIKLPGLQLRVSSKGLKTFGVRTNFEGKTVRVTLGAFPKITVEEARKLAKGRLATIAEGKNPNALKKAYLAKQITLQQCLDEYLKSRSSLKETTAKSYVSILNQYLGDWLNKPLLQIRRDHIEDRHKAIGKTFPTSANKVMRIVRALFEYAHGKYEDENGDPVFAHNPVKRLSHARAWFKETRRISFIKTSDLKQWYEAVDTGPQWLDTPDPVLICDYLKLVLFTGLRRREAAGLRWDWIDFDQKTLALPDTKNGYPHNLPLSGYLYNLLKSREDNGSEFVFPGSGKTGHLEEPKKSVANIRSRSEIYFTIHDLRRTFITIAESLDIRDYTLKRLLNHRSSGDVTDGYIMSDVERLREPMEKISAFIQSTVS